MQINIIDYVCQEVIVSGKLVKFTVNDQGNSVDIHIKGCGIGTPYKLK